MNDPVNSQAGRREVAFGELYRSHLVAIAGYAARRSSPENAVDVVAETLVVAWRRFDEIPAEPAVRPWLFGVARRVLANQRRGTLRRHALHARLCAAWVEPVADNAATDLTPLRRALDTLSESDRDILLLAGVEELKPTEIAVVLDVSPEVARNRLSRARRRLRDALAEIRTISAGHLPSESESEGEQ